MACQRRNSISGRSGGRGLAGRSVGFASLFRRNKVGFASFHFVDSLVEKREDGIAEVNLEALGVIFHESDDIIEKKLVGEISLGHEGFKIVQALVFGDLEETS